MSTVAQRIGADNLYNRWVKLNVQLNLGKLSKSKTDEVNHKWKEAKSHDEKEKLVLDLTTRMRNQKGALFGYLKPVNPTASPPPAAAPSVVRQPPPVAAASAAPSTVSDDVPPAPLAHKQAEAVQSIAKLNRSISELTAIQQSLGLTDNQGTQLNRLFRQKKELEKKVHELEASQKRSKEYRAKRKHNLEAAIEENPELGKRLRMEPNAGPGRRPIEYDYPDVREAIISIISGGASAEERRRSEQLRMCQSLDDLVRELHEQDILVSRSATYLRLLPRNPKSREGQRHVNPVAVRAARAQNTARKHHDDAHFCTATIRMLKDLATLFPSCTLVISQDDKCRVPLGLPAANKQAPILMGVERIELPDHDFVIAPQHKLIPSVYAVCRPGETEVQYKGPTFVAVRSGKHDSSTAFTHSEDFSSMQDSQAFSTDFRLSDGSMKPLWIFLVDGGPDENPRYEKTLRYFVRHFQRNEVDAIFVATNAPGHSAFNPVERRMAPLSKKMSGLVLPPDTFGSHLRNGVCVDTHLEKENFRAAGDLLAKLWDGMEIASCPVIAQFVSPPSADAARSAPELPSELWLSEHVRQSQYVLQIVKCKFLSCCAPPRSKVFDLLPNRFLPTLKPYKHTEMGPEMVRLVDENARTGGLLQQLALLNCNPRDDCFDRACPSQQTALKKRMCKNCDAYFPSISRKNRHEKQCTSFGHSPADEEDDDCSTQYLTDPQIDPSLDLIMPTYENIFEIANEFED